MKLAFERQIMFVPSKEAGFVFATRPNRTGHEIIISLRGVELLWALAYAHSVIYKHVVAARHNGYHTLDPTGSPELALAFEVLDFSLTHHRLPLGEGKWPNHFPKSEGARQIDSEEDVTNERFADELCLCGVAWILHHELGHILADHPLITTNSLAEESEADKAATKWLLEDVDQPMMILKRGLGIALGTIALAALEMNLPGPAQSAFAPTHPKAADRMHAALDHAAFGDDHQVFDFAAVALKIHFDRAGLTVPTQTYETARDCFDDYCFEMQRWAANRTER